MRMFSFCTAAMGLALFASPAQAILVEYQFSGTVQNNAADNITIRDTTGTQQPYKGAPVSFPYQIGDLITFAFKSFLPLSGIPPSADGIYRFKNVIVGSGGVGASTNLTISGGSGATSEQFTQSSFAPAFGYEMVYNSNPGVPDSERLTLDFTGGSNGAASALQTPGYFYDEATGNINNSSQRGRCSDLDREGCSTLIAGKSEAVIRDINVLQIDPQFGPAPFRRGRFGDVNITGQWSVPVVNDNNPAPVPAPSMLLLFGLGVGALAWRRQKHIVRNT